MSATRKGFVTGQGDELLAEGQKEAELSRGESRSWEDSPMVPTRMELWRTTGWES